MSTPRASSKDLQMKLAGGPALESRPELAKLFFQLSHASTTASINQSARSTRPDLSAGARFGLQAHANFQHANLPQNLHPGICSSQPSTLSSTTSKSLDDDHDDTSPFAPSASQPPQQSIKMGRLHSNGKGISASAVPYSRSAPSWLKTTPDQVVDQICKLAKKGATPSQIGVILRDSHGIAQVKVVTGMLCCVPSAGSRGGREGCLSVDEG